METITLRCGLIKKYQFPRFPSFRFCVIPKIEISESFTLLKFLVVYETQNRKNDLKQKTLTMWFEKKKCQGFRVFEFALYLKSKTWKPRKLFVYFKFLSLRLQD